jgi:hypothetical protein
MQDSSSLGETAMSTEIRDHLNKLLAWEDAHAGFEKSVEGIPAHLHGTRPEGLPHSPWELLEHLRITQHDILDFCRNPDYQELEWPEDYWPKSPAPPDAEAWNASVKRFLDDRRQLQALASDSAVELTARIPHGGGQTYLRELLLVADHSAYHLGQLVLVRRMLGVWR